MNVLIHSVNYQPTARDIQGINRNKIKFGFVIEKEIHSYNCFPMIQLPDNDTDVIKYP